MARGRSPHQPTAFTRLGSGARLNGVGGERISFGCSRFTFEGRGRVLWPQVAPHELFGRGGRISGSRDEVLIVRMVQATLTEAEGVSELEPGLYLLSNSELTRIPDASGVEDLEGDALVAALEGGLSDTDVRHLQETVWAADEDGDASLLTIACRLTDYRDVDTEATRAQLEGLLARGLVRDLYGDERYRLTDLGFFLLSRPPHRA